MNEKIALDHEMIDLMVTMGIAFREHRGKSKYVRRCAERILRRLQFPETQKLCQSFIDDPDNTEYTLNVLTANWYGRAILTITHF